MKKATSGKNYIVGRVIHGDHFGRELGFPTANLDRKDYIRRKLKIKFGIWAGWTEILDPESKTLNLFKAAIVIGPIDNNGLPKIEAYLLDFTGNLYGKKIQLSPISFIRPFKKFKNIEDLKRQIKQDVLKIIKLK